jgi:lysine biosynthesis protein LysW
VTKKVSQQKEVPYKIKCNDCGLDIEAPKDVTKGEILSCSGCGVEYEVTKVKPDKTLDFDYLTKEGEDWGE